MEPVVLVVGADRVRGGDATELVAGMVAAGEYVRTPAEAVGRVRKSGQVQALVVERDLPGDVDAFDAVAVLREWCDAEEVPIVVVASSEDDAAVRRSLESRCTAYIVESDPVARAQIAALTAALAGCLGRSG
jgi:CheY-like chemotaxis protein